MGRKLTEIPEEVALQAMQMWFKGSSKEEVAKTLGLAPSRVGYASVKGVRLATEFIAAQKPDDMDILNRILSNTVQIGSGNQVVMKNLYEAADKLLAQMKKPE
jgi:predicted transcriptional regulator